MRAHRSRPSKLRTFTARPLWRPTGLTRLPSAATWTSGRWSGDSPRPWPYGWLFPFFFAFNFAECAANNSSALPRGISLDDHHLPRGLGVRTGNADLYVTAQDIEEAEQSLSRKAV